LSTPPRVVLSEAIEVARRYAGEDSTSFIHAVLDGVVKRLGKMGKGAAPAVEGSREDQG